MVLTTNEAKNWAKFLLCKSREPNRPKLERKLGSRTGTIRKKWLFRGFIYLKIAGMSSCFTPSMYFQGGAKRNRNFGEISAS